MKQRAILLCLAASLGAVGCGSTDVDGTGGEAGGGGTGGDAGIGGGVGGQGGAGGEGGAGGAGGEALPTPLMDRADAGLAYQLECCQCQNERQCYDLDSMLPITVGGPISESACLALAQELPLSDRKNECFDDVILGEEQMSFANRLACLIEVDFAAVDCLAGVNECSESPVADCLDARTTAQLACPKTTMDVRELLPECQTTVAEDGVDAFLDSRAAQCDCITDCTNTEPEPEAVECMVDTLQLAIDMLEPADRFTGLLCITKFWRQRAVCFGNETSCDGAVTACSDIPLPEPPCEISGTVLDDCLIQ